MKHDANFFRKGDVAFCRRKIRDFGINVVELRDALERELKTSVPRKSLVRALQDRIASLEKEAS